MPNLSSVLRSEIIRISRKEIKASVTPLKSMNSALNKTVSEFKKKVAGLETEIRRLQSAQPTSEKPEKSPEIPEKLRISSKTILSLRAKLGLSQGDFARLLDVSSNSVFMMEHKKGRLNLRSKTLSNLIALKQMGKREVTRKLEEMKK
ncbi:MAG: hypothetical protein JW863_05365 [Chitinispirillaceae bacterium]|nr:hypothetical protein [Chitinispirillaceae bacterium]